jgi:C4-type Zn-finger protein
MAKITRMIEAARCFRCDTMIYAIEPVDDTPEFGTVRLSVTVCACCGHLMIVEHDLTLREPTTDEFRKAANHPDVVAEMRSAIY